MRITIESRDTIEINEAQVSKWKSSKKQKINTKITKNSQFKAFHFCYPSPPHTYPYTHPKKLTNYKNIYSKGAKES